MSAREYREWQEFWSIDPWGEQRADMRMAQIVWAAVQSNTKEPVAAQDFLLFPDEANELPDDVDDEERRWMLKLQAKGVNE